MTPTPDGLRLRALAQELLAELDGIAPPRAALLAGSAGEGTADALSDVDLIAYYDEVPTGLATGEQVRSGVACQVFPIAVATVQQALAQLECGAGPDSPRFQ